MNTLRWALAASLLTMASWAQALEIAPYSATALAAAQKAQQPVALHFHADWCSTCRAQQKSLESLRAEKGLDLTVLVANVDTDKDLMRKFTVKDRSTLVVFRGSDEKARVVGETSADKLRAALKTAL